MAVGIKAKKLLRFVPEVLWLIRFANLNHNVMLFGVRRGFLLAVLPTKSYLLICLFCFLLIVLSWTLTFDVLSELCEVWHVKPTDRGKHRGPVLLRPQVPTAAIQSRRKITNFRMVLFFLELRLIYASACSLCIGTDKCWASMVFTDVTANYCSI